MIATPITEVNSSAIERWRESWRCAEYTAHWARKHATKNVISIVFAATSGILMSADNQSLIL